MMKRWLLAFGLCLAAAPAWAACGVTNLQVKDNAAVTAAVPYADDGSGGSNCSPQIQIKQGGNVANVLSAGADAMSNSTPGLLGYGANLLFNGTTWDRWRGDTTNGAFVNVKSSVAIMANQGSANATPWNQNVSQWGGSVVGAMANYGTSPGAVLVPGVNAFVTNANTNGQKTSANSSPVVIASDQGNLPGNTAQVNGVTTQTGAGAVGTGSQRVAVGQDSTTIAGSNPGRTYNTIAASQNAQALTGGGGGATGDYLSHCVVIPTSTSPGVVTILDNATTVYAFPGGASSLSNLVPFTIPVGAFSVSGAWKITTGASLSAVCTGKFS